MDLGFTDLAGAWISIFLTLAVLSFLYADNPIYKIAEHLFLGVSIGYGVTEMVWSVAKPNLYDKLMDGKLIYIVPLILSVMLLLKVSRKIGWVARIPLAFLVSAYAAVKMTGEASGKLLKQVEQSMPDMVTSWNEHGLWSWAADGAGVLSDTFLVVGLTACLIHFYFSEISEKVQRIGLPLAGAAFLLVFVAAFTMAPLEDTLGRVIVALLLGVCASAPLLTISPYKPWLTRFGVLVLMLSFGASFGYTVMGRISLAIGRAQHLLGQDRPVEEVAQIHPTIATFISLGLIIAFLVVWRRQAEPQT